MTNSSPVILVVFIPEDFLEPVKEALFNAGAGEFPDYTHCAFEQKGIGQFKPTVSANPYIGEANTIEKVVEYRVEFFCAREKTQAIIEALIEAHPYEQPAYYVLNTLTVD